LRARRDGSREAAGPASAVSLRKRFFFEKKKQKTFALRDIGVGAFNAHAPASKSFCALFSKSAAYF
jgi:hypothetical protein